MDSVYYNSDKDDYKNKKFNVSVKTIRSDLNGLVDLKLLEIVPINQRLMGYTGVKNIEDRIANIAEIKGK